MATRNGTFKWVAAALLALAALAASCGGTAEESACRDECAARGASYAGYWIYGSHVCNCAPGAR